MRIYFARHGESEANVLREISNRGLKHPLTRKGRRQACDLARRLEKHKVVQVYSSPLLRALETGVHIANNLEVDLEVVDGLREYDCGLAEGRSDKEAWKLWKDLWEDWLSHQRYERCIEGGETFIEVRDRFVPFIESLVQRYGKRDKTVVCVAHGGVYCMMLPLVLTNITPAYLPQHGFGNTDCLVAELGEDGLRFKGWL